MPCQDIVGSRLQYEPFFVPRQPVIRSQQFKKVASSGRRCGVSREFSPRTSTPITAPVHECYDDSSGQTTSWLNADMDVCRNFNALAL